MNIYIHTQGARVVREGRHLLVKKGEDTFRTLFVEKLRQVVLFGNVELTPAARSSLLRHGVDTVFCTEDGRYRGRFATPEPKNVMLRKRQFNLLDDPVFAINMGRQLVSGKLINQATLLMRVQRTRDRSEPKVAAREIRALLGKVAEADSLESLRGYEGRSSALYFGAFRWGLLNDHGFCRRVRRPPTDPVNAVLSLLYTFLFNRIYAAVRLVNLDPYPAFLHVSDYGRHSLIMDLMEEFRVIVADTLCLSLFNLKILQADDFRLEYPPNQEDDSALVAPPPDVTADPYGHMSDLDSREFFELPSQRMSENHITELEQEDTRGKPAVKLNPDAFRRVVENFERKLTTEFFYPPEERTITYAEAMTAQAGLYRRVIEGELKMYQALQLR